jgi:hypothetical protein
MGTQQEFENTVKQVTDTLSFDNNSNRVQVFETNIRILGGLVSLFCYVVQCFIKQIFLVLVIRSFISDRSNI